MSVPQDTGSSRLQEIAFYLSDAQATPASVEWLWSEPLEDGHFRIQSAPYHVRGISSGDVVEAAGDGELYFVRLVCPSGHSTLRVFLEPQVVPDDFFRPLESLGCTYYPSEREAYFVVDVPQNVAITDVLDFLSQGQDADLCDWMDGSISETHAGALRAVMDPSDLPDWVPRG